MVAEWYFGSGGGRKLKERQQRALMVILCQLPGMEVLRLAGVLGRHG